MKRTSLVMLSLVVLSPWCAAPLFADQDQRIIPAGSLISCTLSEPKVSSKTTAVGDPVLCQLSHSEHYGRSVLPYKSYLEGRFEDYKDPGHFVGKGWMELKFDRMVIEPDTIIPVDARVVDVPGYRVDNQGRILGKGHATRDAVLWSLPILWPVDLVMLPMRGPRPTLKEETHLTLKVMDDLAVPVNQAPQPDVYGLQHRPIAQNDPPPMPDQQPGPEMADAAPQYQPDQQQDQQLAQQPDQYQDYNYAPQPVPQVAPPALAYGPAYYPPVYAYGSYGYGGYGYAGRPYGFYRSAAPGFRGYGYGGARGYAGAPRAYGYAGGARGYAGGARAYGYAGGARGYAGAARGYAGGGARGYGGGGHASMGGRGGGGGGRR